MYLYSYRKLYRKVNNKACTLFLCNSTTMRNTTKIKRTALVQIKTSVPPDYISPDYVHHSLLTTPRNTPFTGAVELPPSSVFNGT